MKLHKIGSIMKEPSRSTEKLAYNLKKKSSVLIPDGLDGWNALCFAFKGHYVTLYKPISIFINGGNINLENIDYKIYGLKQRIKAYDLYKNMKYKIQNFYECDNFNKYNLVYVNRSLNRECNSHIKMEDKINTLKSAADDNGEIYLVYLLADDENDYITYPPNQYPRLGEIPSYFNEENWKFIFIRENYKAKSEKGHFGNSKVHYHKIGFVHAKKVSKKTIDSLDNHKFRYYIKIHNEII